MQFSHSINVYTKIFNKKRDSFLSLSALNLMTRLGHSVVDFCNNTRNRRVVCSNGRSSVLSSVDVSTDAHYENCSKDNDDSDNEYHLNKCKTLLSLLNLLHLCLPPVSIKFVSCNTFFTFFSHFFHNCEEPFKLIRRHFISRDVSAAYTVKIKN